MTRTNIVFIAILFLILTACKKSDKELEMEQISSAVKDLTLNPKITWLVLLPNLGCKGCIQEGEAFMKESIKNKDVFL